MDVPLDQILSLIHSDSGSGLINSLLLALILLNIRSLKKAIIRIEDNHDHRIGSIELKQERQEGRILALEQGV